MNAGLARSELILGGQKSGKSARAEQLAAQWLTTPGHHAVLIATAQAWDPEMQERIARHQRDRTERVPGLRTLEASCNLPEALRTASRPDTLVVVDCLTLWLTQLMMPPDAAVLNSNRTEASVANEEIASLLIAIESAPGPVVLVGNEIGLGVIPMGREVRAFVDALGRLNQSVARACERLTFMVAGHPMTVKDGA